MAAKEKEYQRLPGRGIRREGVIVSATRSICTVWMGKDHLLCVDTQGGYTENYKRFYYRDIQAITIRRTTSYRNVNIALGALAGLMGVICLVSSVDVLQWFFGIAAGIFGVFLAINAAYGPTCETEIQTAVQREDLPSLRRLWTAEKALNRVRPLIESAQGMVTPEEAREKLQLAGTAAPVPAFIPATPAAFVPRQVVVKHYQGRAHAILFWLCLADIPSTLISIVFKNFTLQAFGILLTVLTLGAAIFALIRQQHTDLPVLLRRLPIVTLVSTVFFFVVSAITGVFLVAMNNGSGSAVAEGTETNVVVMALVLLSTIANAIIGTLGLMRLKEFHQQAQLPPPIPSIPSVPPVLPLSTPGGTAGSPSGVEPGPLDPPVVPPPPVA